MKKDIHPNVSVCEYTCASCGAKFSILSTKSKDASLDVCSNCHPFYVGGAATTTLRGRAEKLASKFEAGTSVAKSNNKPTKKQTKKSSKQQVAVDLQSL